MGTKARLRLPWADSQLPGDLTGCASSWREKGAGCCNFPGWRPVGAAVHLLEWREGKVFNLVFLPCV